LASQLFKWRWSRAGSVRGLGHCFDRRDNLISANFSGPKSRVVIPGARVLELRRALLQALMADMGGDPAQVRTAYAEILASAKAYAPQARIIGVSCDPQLGPVLLFGSGGVIVEFYNDVALRRCPITRREAQAMIAEVKGARLLQGFRGRPAADLEALADTLVRVSHLAMHMEGHLAELDINPLMVLQSGQGVKAVGALVVFRST
jgi:acyl-CoA synthetase (NDP forming)